MDRVEVSSVGPRGDEDGCKTEDGENVSQSLKDNVHDFHWILVQEVNCTVK